MIRRERRENKVAKRNDRWKTEDGSEQGGGRERRQGREEKRSLPHTLPPPSTIGTNVTFISTISLAPKSPDNNAGRNTGGRLT